MLELLIKPLTETIYMVGVSTILTVLIGLPLGAILVITSQDHIMPNKVINTILSYIVNITRSFPYIIFMIVLFPLTKLIVGTRIGTTAAIVPLTLAAIPFFARIVESALMQVPWGLIEAALSMGATEFEVIKEVMIKEALSPIIMGVTTTIINILGYSAMAGSVGGGGLGDLAIAYGYLRWQADVMIVTVIVLIVLVQLIQSIGNFVAAKVNKN